MTLLTQFEESVTSIRDYLDKEAPGWKTVTLQLVYQSWNNNTLNGMALIIKEVE